MTVREGDDADRDFVLDLAVRFAETRPHWRSEEEIRRGTERALERAFDAPRGDEVIFIAVDATGERAGFVYLVTHIDFFTGEEHAHVSEIAVMHDGRGAGRALMKRAEEWSRERGSRYVSLHVNANNGRGRSFYVELGYDEEYTRMVKLL
jgi:ribosomal protein S18 acetylase RimI-like enzyme